MGTVYFVNSFIVSVIVRTRKNWGVIGVGHSSKFIPFGMIIVRKGRRRHNNAGIPVYFTYCGGTRVLLHNCCNPWARSTTLYYNVKVMQMQGS